MWIFTKYGFYSVTKSRKEPEKLQVRARRREHLQNLQAKFSLQGEILETPNSDYKWRIIVNPLVWERVMSDIALDVDYPNFKKTIKDAEYAKALLEVWSEMYLFQLTDDEIPTNRSEREAFRSFK